MQNKNCLQRERNTRTRDFVYYSSTLVIAKLIHFKPFFFLHVDKKTLFFFTIDVNFKFTYCNFKFVGTIFEEIIADEE